MKGDTDGDGQLDGAEVVAGTDVLDSADSLRIVSIDGASGDIVLEWTSVLGKSYEVLWSTDLLEPGSDENEDNGEAEKGGAEEAKAHDGGAGGVAFGIFEEVADEPDEEDAEEATAR